ncbi:HIT family protein [Halarcobacter ebronensis]|uniref:HIT family hydrolase n=1 Tax=Halarcobacter ebronensis TaxID=1462615 RepID=A0A4V1LZQ6_9BACT|nr:HIT domain-containing protein [Halarcobacter ebronensis]QKF81423.1 histidine triad nucleotide-binding protein, Fhit branch [Halarcobacter ebronensis]RXK01817.1 HIT family hydrolase [Halarcobacter ebronensis]
MEHLYAPWRYSYVTEEKIEGCIFCHISKHLDEKKHHVLFHDEFCYVVMNKFPYSPGHLMVIPHFHTDKIEELEAEIWDRMSVRIRQAVCLLKDTMNCEGVNIGMNLGKAAGAGIAQHVHYHAMPRWLGDTNFISSIGGMRVYPADFEEIFLKLKAEASKYFI